MECAASTKAGAIVMTQLFVPGRGYRLEVPLGMPSVRVPAKLSGLSPLAGTA